MKTTNMIMTIVASCIAICSCSKWLSTDPLNDFPADDFYKTPKEAEQALIGVYSGLLPIAEYSWNMGELRADHLWTSSAEDASTQRDYLDIMTFSVNQLMSGMINDAWSDYYKIIARANLLIERMEDTVFDETLEKDLRSSWEAEARVLRAFAYFDLVRYFGRVPIVTRTMTAEEAMSTGQSESEDVYENVIIPDLLYAIENLDFHAYDYEGKEAAAGRVNKIVAQALLGRVYATKAGFPLKDESKRELALEQLKAVVEYADTTGRYWAKDGEAWSEMWLSDNDNRYHIWEIQYAAKDGYGNPMVYWTAPKVDDSYIDLNMSGYNIYGRDAFLALFETDNDGDGESDDVRRIGTINYEGNHSTRFVTKFFEHKIKRERLGYSDNTMQVVTRTYFPINFPLIRLEDVMLLYAELAGNTPLSIEYVNRIRKRAGIGELSGDDLADFATAVDQERQRELAGEGIRWHDIVRRDTWQTLMKQKFIDEGSDEDGDITIERVYEYSKRVMDGTYLYPIPDAQMRVKAGLYEQNEAYR